MKKLTSASLDSVLLKKLQARKIEKQKAQWDNGTGLAKKFKENITLHLLMEQGRRCGYCGERLHGDSPPRDHIAPKSAHGEWTFFPQNIVLACYTCNSERKKETDTVSYKGTTYGGSDFYLIHPYEDDPTHHICFVGDDESVIIQCVFGSHKGNYTIDMFKLDTPERSKQRAKDLIIDRDLSYLGPHEKSLLLELIHSSAALRLKFSS